MDLCVHPSPLPIHPPTPPRVSALEAPVDVGVGDVKNNGVNSFGDMEMTVLIILVILIFKGAWLRLQPALEPNAQDPSSAVELAQRVVEGPSSPR